MTWDELFFALADTIASKSKDRSVKVGCVVVGPDHEVRSMGYNGFPRGADDAIEAWHERPKKYAVTAHAELNAVCNAARCGTQLLGCTAYVTLPPCAACVLALVQAGVMEIRYCIQKDWDGTERWRQQFADAQEICEATGTKLTSVGYAEKL